MMKMINVGRAQRGFLQRHILSVVLQIAVWRKALIICHAAARKTGIFMFVHLFSNRCDLWVCLISSLTQLNVNLIQFKSQFDPL